MQIIMEFFLALNIQLARSSLASIQVTTKCTNSNCCTKQLSAVELGANSPLTEPPKFKFLTWWMYHKRTQFHYHNTIHIHTLKCLFGSCAWIHVRFSATCQQLPPSEKYSGPVIGHGLAILCSRLLVPGLKTLSSQSENVTSCERQRRHSSAYKHLLLNITWLDYVIANHNDGSRNRSACSRTRLSYSARFWLKCNNNIFIHLHGYPGYVKLYINTAHGP